MKAMSGLAFALALGCLSCCGQTNNCSVSPIPFCLSPIRLRTDTQPVSQQSLAASFLPPTVSVRSDQLTLATSASDDDFHSRVVRSGEFYLTRPVPGPSTPVSRVLNGLFAPEVVHLGRVGVSSPIVTVIKRKNPLCLLSGISTQAGLSGQGGIVYKILELNW